MGFIFTLILFAATLVLSEVLKPKVGNENARPGSLGDFKFPTAVEGRPVPLIWGTVKLDGPNVVWYGDLRTRAVTEKVKTGIFSSKRVTTGFQYNVGVQMGLCRGPVDSVRRIWIGDDEVFSGNSTFTSGQVDVSWDEPNLFGGDKGQGGTSGTATFFEGSESQLPSTYLSAFQQEGGDTPAYRGTCYLAPSSAPFYVGNSTSIKPWKFEITRIPTGLSSSNASVNGGLDANPAHVLYEILTNTEWGLGFPASDIDTTNFQAAADTLAAEGNGFSFVLDNQRSLLDLLREIERQMDGVVVQDRLTGQWQINLARADYTVGNLPSISTSNVLEIRDFRRAAWQDTQNHVRVKFADRARDYFETYASAQDMANVQIQNANIIADQTFPGVKDRDLANSIAWRELRSLSRPTAKATLVVDRSFFALNPGDPVRWSDPDLGFTDLVMRITQIDLGEVNNGRITLQLVEDVFATDVPAFAPPGDTGWVPPVDQLVAIPLADHLAFEAPKAFVDRSPDLPGEAPRIWVGVLNQNDGAVDADLFENGTDAGDLAGFLLAGELVGATDLDANNGGYSITIAATPSLKQEILDAFDDGGATLDDIGESLARLVKIGTEFFGFTVASDAGGNNITLSSGVRALMDTVPQVHANGTRVWLPFVNGNLLNRTSLAGSPQVEVLTESFSDTLTTGEATNVAVTVSGNRHLRPYPPASPLFIGGVPNPTTTTLDTTQPSLPIGDQEGFSMDWIRRDFRTGNEYRAILNETTLPTDFPAANTTEHRIEVIDDPNGVADSLFFTDWATADGSVTPISRTKILRETGGVIPTRMRVEVETRHTIDSVVYEATQQARYDFDTVSAGLAGDFNFGVLFNSQTSNSWTAPDTGTYNISVGANLDAGSVQYRINGGTWTTSFSSGASSGTIPGVTASDTIEIRHVGGSILDREETLCVVESPISAENAYAVMVV